MNCKAKKNGQEGLSRRQMLKCTVAGLATGLAAPRLWRLPAANAAAAVAGGRNMLITYYSRTGNTRTMANYVHDMVGGDLVEIKTVDPYPAEYRATTEQAKKELESGYKPPLTTKIESMESYDVVFVGSPCWWGTIATPVISFLSAYDFSGKTLVPFMTHGGSGLGRTMSHVTELCPNATVVQGLAIRGSAIGSSRNEVADWLRELNMA